MSKFIALPVGQGDAFYLEKKDLRVLVDGGKSKSAILQWMSSICRTDYLDVLVCTHNDADHANGVAGLLENWEGTIKEVWLPGSWTYRMKDLFAKPHIFCRELVENICKCKDNDNVISLEGIYRRSEINKVISDNKANEFELGSVIEESKHFPSEFFEIFLDCPDFEPFYFDYPHRINRKHKNLFPIFWQSIEAAKNIREITELAYHRGCKIRFFEFGNTASGGETGKFESVYAKEIASVKAINIDALQFLSLSTANKESLVFYSPENKSEPAVLFTADSDLNFKLPAYLPRRGPIIVTSPHHGSEHNRNAYYVVNGWLNSGLFPIWIRSDCKSRNRPGTSLKKQQNRCCTLCNCGTHPKNTVKLHSRKGCWQRTKGTRWCSCK
ncbi:hypothetical protein CHISP_1221 [Chitinispirillum alkaliphilum]|nr:hypothetical protein CHISP_1221 [Chitinispirillum alkaliphilum]